MKELVLALADIPSIRWTVPMMFVTTSMSYVQRVTGSRAASDIWM